MLRTNFSILVLVWITASFDFGLIGLATAQETQTDLDTSAFDPSIRVQDDLFQHVNGGWLATARIPADKSDYGSFGKLADQSQKQIREIIEQSAEGTHETGSDAQKVGDFYKSYMDVGAADRKGVEPLADDIAFIEQLSSKLETWTHFGTLSQIGVNNPIGVYVSQDAKNSSQYIVHLIQSGFTLPDRDYYLRDDDENSAAARQALRAYIAKLFELAEIDNGHIAAEQIFELEKQLARISWPRVQLRDAEKRYNKRTDDELQAMTPSLDWNELLHSTGIPDVTEVNVTTPSFFEEFEPIFENTSLEIWKRYLQFRLLDAYAPYLSEPFVEAHFQLHEHQLGGVPSRQPRWKHAVKAIAGEGAGDFGALGEVAGRLYVEKHFKPEAKARMEEAKRRAAAKRA